ncbi:MAG: hypothetical protein ABII21_04300 [bacterium]
MKKSWLIISIWIAILVGAIFWTVSKYPIYTPSFPYHQTIAHLPRQLSILGNFDGANYLWISTHGYPIKGGEVAFFPLYPILISTLVNLGIEPLYAALIFNLFCVTIIGLLIHQLYPKLSAKFLLLFLSFPVSFYLVSAYTETLFILFFLTFMLCLKQQRWWLAALIAGLASGTRLVGAIFGVILIIEYFRYHPITINHKLLTMFILSELGLLAYMYFLFTTRGDPLSFIHAQPLFGMGRSGGEIIFLPQVLYRYLKMLLTVDTMSLLYWRVLWELLTFLASLYLLIKYWVKLTPAERIYTAWVVLLPTLSGTLSSFPRYALVAIPLFLAVAKEIKPIYLTFIVLAQSSLLIFNLILFTRGLFVA